MKKQVILHSRFIERDYEFERMRYENKYMTYEQMQSILDGIDYWNDLSFKFFSDGSVEVKDNNTEEYIRPSDLTGVCQDYYIWKRIEMIGKKLGEENKARERELLLAKSKNDTCAKSL